MCFRSQINKENIGDMSFHNFKRVLDQFDSVIKVNLSGLGENFLHSDFFKMIHYVKTVKKIPFVWNSTNGQIMDEYMAKELINSGLDWLLISVDSPIARTYEEIRRGGNFHLLLNNISKLIEVKNRHKADHLRITLDTTIQRGNIAQLEGVLTLANKLEVRDVLFAAVIENFAGDMDSDVGQYVLTDQRRQELSKLAKDLDIALEWANYPFCFEPWLRPCITWDGYLIPCYVRPVAEKFNFGNIFDEPFTELWNGSKMQAFRSRVSCPKLCHGCQRTWK